ncbi:MAG: hypothetical protein KDB33_16980 [Acidimicrobiales bacterium]|nr:hypothetical protein [Acidimicrobiales bacterium]MCB1262059.1 hypothetical protein [Acidimicrobiales bacterium]
MSPDATYPDAPPISTTAAAPGAPLLPDRPPSLGDPIGPPSPPPAPPTPPPTGGPGRGVLLGVAAIIAVGLIAAALLLRTGDAAVETADPSTSSTTVESSTTSSVPEESTTTAPGQTTTTTLPSGDPITQAELDAAMAELMAFVEDVRGLPFIQEPEVALLDPQAFNDALQAQVSDEELRAQAEQLSQLGLLPPGVDPVADMRAQLGARIAGWYDAKTKVLTIRNLELDEDARQILVHELTHALDDQHFDLDRPEYVERKDEIAFGFRALVEGSARRVERFYRDQFNPENESPGNLNLPDLSEQDPSDYGAIAADMMEAPYVYGEYLIEETIRYYGGDGVIRSLFADPPDTSEKVLHPDKYLSFEDRIDVPPPPTDGAEVIDDGVLGELMLRNMLEAKLGREAAVEASSGWGGDWFVRYQNEAEGTSCLRVDFQMDSTGDMAELETAFEAWSDAGGMGEITKPDDETLRFTNCTPPVGSGEGGSVL